MGVLLFLIMLFMAVPGFAQRGGGPGPGPGPVLGLINPPLASLKTVTPPTPVGAERYVADQQKLVALGKAFFWDMQAGSDGRTACATCHFHAGADHRLTNQLSGPAATVNQTLAATDFPFHQLSNPANRASTVLRDKQQVAGSAGVVARGFSEAQPGSEVDGSTAGNSSAQFAPGGISVRQVTGRNTPSVINAVFNVRNFWDGRARELFTGATPFGDSDPALNALVVRNGVLTREAVRIANASLASQAVGPALNSVEMSWAGRKWADLGRKLLSLPPLARQKVSPTDSVLGAMANPDGNGLKPENSYASLIAAAFRPELYASAEITDGHTQAENNFALFWGLAIQAYEATLIANDSRVDQFLEGNLSALSSLEQQGLNEFRNGASQCVNCHNGAEITAAGASVVRARAALPQLNPAAIGFFRIGVRTIEEDTGLGATDDFGVPLFATNPPAAAGTFKAPGLRNVEFTGPYFHNGGQATLEQVLEFYGRNGDFPQGGNLGPGIGAIRLNANDRTQIVAFLKALSDERVRYQRAPFDHPSLCVPNGHVTYENGALAVDTGQLGVVATDKSALVEAVGAEGATAPLQTFEELLSGMGADGSRANNMTTTCSP